MMLEFDDPAVFAEYERAELEDPTPRKEVDANRNIYFSRDFCAPRDIGAPVLCDLGSAVHGRGPHTSFIQPKFYRAPEVVLGVPWTFSADIWNVGCMVRHRLQLCDIWLTVAGLGYIPGRFALLRLRPRL